MISVIFHILKYLHDITEYNNVYVRSEHRVQLVLQDIWHKDFHVRCFS